jgi:homoserine kinase
MVRGFAALHPPDHFEFTIRSDIPLSGGLGTSAAAIVAGLVAADSIFELGADLLAEATKLEGHPDNVAAALLGGFVLCADGHAERFEPPQGLECLLVVPSQAVRTAKAREALPSRIPVSDAVFNIAHASLLVLGLAQNDLGLVARGLRDRIHQPRRAHLYPRSWDLVQHAADMGALGATVSGAGPTVLVWCDFQSTGAVAKRLKEHADGWAEVLRVPFTPTGARARF